jgi:hypothetical protein
MVSSEMVKTAGHYAAAEAQSIAIMNTAESIVFPQACLARRQVRLTKGRRFFVVQENAVTRAKFL